MMVEDGRRLIVNNLDLRYAISHDGNLLLEQPDRTESNRPSDPYTPECHSREALELFRLFPEARKQLRLSTAVRMSASFPFFSPAVSLPTVPRRRLVDAGYYDNYGVSLASSWLMSRSNRQWFLDKFSKILLIQIRDGVDEPQRRLDVISPDPSNGPSRAGEEFTSPIEGLYNARVGSTSFRNDGQLELLTQMWAEITGWSTAQAASDTARLPMHRQAFQVVNFEFPNRVALSWYLSDSERKLVEAGMKRREPNPFIDFAFRH
jgi:hypothetical protein